MEACQRLTIEKSEYFFSRREIREYTGFGNTQVKIHLHRLEELEYLFLHRSSRGQGFVYELAYEGKGKDGKPFLHGLIDTARLREKWRSDGNRSGFLNDRSGLKGNLSGGGRPEAPSKSGGCRVEKNLGDTQQKGVSEETPENTLKRIVTDEVDKSTSCSQSRHTPAFPLAPNPHSRGKPEQAGKDKGNGSGKLITEAD